MTNEENAHIVVLVANDADESFVSSLLSYYQESSSKSVKRWDVLNLKGIKRRRQRFDNRIDTLINQYEEKLKIIIFIFCSNTGLYPFAEKPVIDWDKIKKMIQSKKIFDIYEIQVNDIIEDWVLDDIKGVCGFLGIDQPNIMEGENGYKKISFLFKKACKQYLSGYSILDVLPYLNLEEIRNKRKESLYKLEEELLNVNINNSL